MDKPTYVVVNDEGKFLSMFGRWVSEYPDAEEFKTVSSAKRAASEKSCKVVRNYGLESEEVV